MSYKVDNRGSKDQRIIYDYLKGKNTKLINLKQLDRQECIKTMEEYKNTKGIIY